jgi:ribosomal protein L37AE/L43A
MSERPSLRGSRLGMLSYEDERGVELAARQDVSFDCPAGHRTSVTFAEEAEVPALWECRECGAEALRASTERPSGKPVKPARTHWDMLLERRSVADLEELLEERLTLLRAGSFKGGAHLAGPAPRARRKSA